MGCISGVTTCPVLARTVFFISPVPAIPTFLGKVGHFSCLLLPTDQIWKSKWEKYPPLSKKCEQQCQPHAELAVTPAPASCRGGGGTQGRQGLSEQWHQAWVGRGARASSDASLAWPGCSSKQLGPAPDGKGEVLGKQLMPAPCIRVGGVLRLVPCSVLFSFWEIGLPYV